MVDNDDTRIGELLCSAGILSELDLEEALEIAKGTGQLTGRVLVMSGFVTDSQLASALAAQEKIRRGELDIDDAIEAIKKSQ